LHKQSDYADLITLFSQAKGMRVHFSFFLNSSKFVAKLHSSFYYI